MAETALITGASMGLGAEFVRQLARRGVNVLLVARSEERLKQIAAEAEAAGVRTAILACDLSAPGAGQRVVDWVAQLPQDLQPNLLINNAGYGDAGLLEGMDPDRVTGMVMLNIVALTDLTRRMLPTLRKQGPAKARIIQVASVAAFQPLPFFAVYAATKAYVLHLAEALHEELGPEGFRITALCPGVTKTEFGNNGQGLRKEFFDKGATAADVVAAGIRANDKGRVVCATADVVRTYLARFAPRWVVRRVAGVIARKLMG